MFAASKTAGAVSAEVNYIEDVFSTYLYTGNGSTQTITNGIDLSTKGGLVWIKSRSNIQAQMWMDSARGAGNSLSSNLTDAQYVGTSGVSFGSNNFSVSTNGNTNTNASTYASWTFREQPKFFDIVTYTGNGVAGRTVAHNLGSVPGCIVVKGTGSIGYWRVYHRSLGATKNLALNLSDSVDTNTAIWNDTEPTSTNFTLGDNGNVNTSGQNYVAYIFAHNAGGFGLTGTDNVISCGSFTSSSIGLATVDLGYEPQWILYKGSNGVTNWQMVDNMRGFVVGAANAGTSYLNANTSGAEATTPPVGITSTGFNFDGAANITYIYIAIRRGPMKVPTSGTSVFQPTTWTGTGAALQQNVGINYDSFMQWRRNGGYSTPWMDKLRGFGYSIYTQQTTAEVNQTAYIAGPTKNNYVNFVDGTYNLSGEPWLNYAFVRAPSFFDEVCYTGNGSSTGQTLNHNLNAVPELIIWKARSNGVNNWYVYNATVGTEFYVELNTTIAKLAFSLTGSRTPTSSVFYTCTGGDSSNNGNNITYVAYLFATCAGVSKVGSYTGNGSTQTINCGFTGGARFVLIKRTDSTGDWYVYDTARGMTVLTDPYLLLNSTAAESATLGSVTTVSTGFAVNASILAAINTNGASYIFLAIA